MDETIEDTGGLRGEAAPAVPGLLFVFSGEQPCFRVVRMPGRSFIIGREVDGWRLPDERVSREHALVSFDGASWNVRDLGSRNGVFVDGERRAEYSGVPRVLRVGHTLVLARADVRPYVGESVRVEELGVVGPLLRRAYRDIDAAARQGEALLITGETGSGKELAARRFHAQGPRSTGPFIAVNCATVPHGLAERLLFGARKGAYSGATVDAEGLVQAADRGVLFLDEVAELEPEVQAKLLRVLEAREVQPLGANRASPVDVHVCAATHRDLRALAAEGKFRPDLYYRLCQQSARLPGLAERLEEIPWLIQSELGRASAPPSVHARFVEACMLRPWPGNVRELRAELRKSAAAAVAASASSLRPEHLDDLAGRPLNEVSARSAPPAVAGGEAALPGERAANAGESQPHPAGLEGIRRDAERDAMLRALERAGGKRSEAARLLGVSRSTFYLKLKEYGIE